jgi:hypothetical protein
MGYADGEQWMTGHMYLFHNTVFRSDEWLPTGGLGGQRIVKHVVSRNNILHVRGPQNHSLSNNKLNIDNSYDYDLYSGRIPAGVEEHGLRRHPLSQHEADEERGEGVQNGDDPDRQHRSVDAPHSGNVRDIQVRRCIDEDIEVSEDRDGLRRGIRWVRGHAPVWSGSRQST